MSDRHPDTLSADRRTLLISAVAMVALVLVGVVSAAVFTRSACDGIVPTVVTARTSGTDLITTLRAAFPEASADDLDRIEAAVTSLAGSLGPMTAVADVSGAERLAVLGSEGARIAAVGPTTTVLEDWGSAVAATADLGSATVVGGGDTLFALALVNRLTGQVDALRPLAPDLAESDCTDTAVVAEPFAFHLDAADGDLLLLRVDEDADAPLVELFVGVGSDWRAGLEAGTAPPGVLAERVTGRLGAELAVVGRRSAPGDEEPVLVALGRTSGAPRWTVGRGELATLLSSDRADLIEVVAVGEERVVVAVTPDVDGGSEAADAPIQTSVVTLDAGDGSVRATAVLAAGARLLDALVDGTEVTVASVDGDTRVEHVREGAAGTSVLVPDEGLRLAALPGARTMLVAERSVTVIAEGDTVETVVAPLAGRDVAVHDGGSTLLLAGPGDGAVAITFGR